MLKYSPHVGFEWAQPMWDEHLKNLEGCIFWIKSQVQSILWFTWCELRRKMWHMLIDNSLCKIPRAGGAYCTWMNLSSIQRKCPQWVCRPDVNSGRYIDIKINFIDLASIRWDTFEMKQPPNMDWREALMQQSPFTVPNGRKNKNKYHHLSIFLS